MRVYKYYSAKWAHEAILKRRVKVSTIGDLNDLFEFRAIDARDQVSRAKLERWRGNYFSNKGLVSFCKNRKNPVIWSHYACGYRGICLGFDVAKEELCTVKYRAGRAPMSEAEVLEAVRGDTATEADIRLTTKFAHWSYEAEERVFCQLDDPKIIQDKGMYFLPFDYGFNLREVILGPKYQPVTDATLKEKLEAAVAEMVPCTVRSTRPAFRSFNVVFQQNKKLSKEI